MYYFAATLYISAFLIIFVNVVIIFRGAIEEFVERMAQRLDRFAVFISPKRVMEFVGLPFISVVSGGLMSAAIAIWIDHPPWHADHRGNVANSLFLAASLVALIFPVLLIAVEKKWSDPISLGLAYRIHLLKTGESLSDSRAQVLRAIAESERSASTRLFRRRGLANAWHSCSIVVLALWYIYLWVAGVAGISLVLQSVASLAIAAAAWLSRPFFRRRVHEVQLNYLNSLRISAFEIEETKIPGMAVVSDVKDESLTGPIDSTPAAFDRRVQAYDNMSKYVLLALAQILFILHLIRRSS